MKLGIEPLELGVGRDLVTVQPRGVAVQRAGVEPERIQLGVECFWLGFWRINVGFDSNRAEAHLPAVAAPAGEAEL